MENYLFCETLGHWKHLSVCEQKLSMGLCSRSKGKCRPAVKLDLTEEERERRSEAMKRIRKEAE